jgi:hypothetical protein
VPWRPAPDGAIVLSKKVADMLDAYKNAPGVTSGAKRGYFFASLDGKSAGSYVCPGNCSDRSSGSWNADSPDMTYQQIRDKAKKACEAEAATECVLIFSNHSEKQTYRMVGL